MDLKQQINFINERIENAANSIGKSKEDITLIAVSKTVDSSIVQKAYDLGLTEFGENRPQEIRDKSKIINNANWHMIGRLQSNKIKYVVGTTKIIQSVDSENLLLQINDFAKKIDIVQQVLIQINISQELQKGGISINDVDKMMEFAQKLTNIRVKGLMSIGAANASDYELKKMFEKCYNIFIDNRAKKYDNIDMTYLSMGMSNDFETAIKMGSNMVRIGTGIFGSRNYTK